MHPVSPLPPLVTWHTGDVPLQAKEDADHLREEVAAAAAAAGQFYMDILALRVALRESAAAEGAAATAAAAAGAGRRAVDAGHGDTATVPAPFAALLAHTYTPPVRWQRN